MSKLIPTKDTNKAPSPYSLKGVKNALFGGEGLFNTRITGPGRVYLQSMPISNIAARLSPYIRITGSSSDGSSALSLLNGKNT